MLTGLSQEELSTLMGWAGGQGEVSKYEALDDVPAGTEASTLRRLSGLLFVSVDWLLFGPRRYDIATGEELTGDPGPSTHPEAAAVTTRGGPPAPPPSRGSTSRKPRRGESPEATP